MRHVPVSDDSSHCLVREMHGVIVRGSPPALVPNPKAFVRIRETLIDDVDTALAATEALESQRLKVRGEELT